MDIPMNKLIIIVIAPHRQAANEFIDAHKHVTGVWFTYTDDPTRMEGWQGMGHITYTFLVGYELNPRWPEISEVIRRCDPSVNVSPRTYTNQ